MLVRCSLEYGAIIWKPFHATYNNSIEKNTKKCILPCNATSNCITSNILISASADVGV